jgi:hypothetical protein
MLGRSHRSNEGRTFDWIAYGRVDYLVFDRWDLRHMGLPVFADKKGPNNGPAGSF